MYFPYKKMGNRNSGESSGQVAPADIEEGIALGANSWSSWMRLPTSLGASQEEPEDDDPCKCLNLSWSQRVTGFAVCFGLGCAISIMSTFLIFNPVKYALSYSLGNLLSILSTGFLVGPRRQMKYACAPTRIWAFVIYILAIVGTLVSALQFKKKLVTLLFVIVQFAAGIWYTASYVPYGREMLKSPNSRRCTCILHLSSRSD